MPDYGNTLEDKIHIFFRDEVMFTVDDILKRFPDENRRSVYRAINKLEETNRIRYLRFANRRKVYTAQGQSSLPMIKTNQGNVVPISALINAMSSLYDETTGRFKQQDVDEVFIAMCDLFVIAQDDEQMEHQYKVAQKNLATLRGFFVRMTDNIDAVLRHPAMQGDVELFKRAFNTGSDPAIPSAQDLLRFRTWAAKNEKLRNPKD